ncbi:MAG: UvrB/UvrC motif-containing protein [Verrucomicrobia bacterium]|jgi:protein arginine kinase activator|nr:UvrB/UvrC motif-containing protein [Verrucomicrobiota bacterium]
MKCNFCNQKATVFLTQLADGQMKKVCLCENCAKEKGVTDPTGFSLADMLISGVSTSALVPSTTYSPGRSGGKKCPNCGFSLDDLNRIRRFGCSECFQAFRSEVELILRGMHQGGSHVGKVPRGFEEIHARDQKMEELRGLLDEAITTENYEEAASLRDQIRQLELSIPAPTVP